MANSRRMADILFGLVPNELHLLRLIEVVDLWEGVFAAIDVGVKHPSSGSLKLRE